MRRLADGPPNDDPPPKPWSARHFVHLAGELRQLLRLRLDRPGGRPAAERAGLHRHPARHAQRHLQPAQRGADSGGRRADRPLRRGQDDAHHRGDLLSRGGAHRGEPELLRDGGRSPALRHRRGDVQHRHPRGGDALLPTPAHCADDGPHPRHGPGRLVDRRPLSHAAEGRLRAGLAAAAGLRRRARRHQPRHQRRLLVGRAPRRHQREGRGAGAALRSRETCSSSAAPTGTC